MLGLDHVAEQFDFLLHVLFLQHFEVCSQLVNYDILFFVVLLQNNVFLKHIFHFDDHAIELFLLLRPSVHLLFYLLLQYFVLSEELLLDAFILTEFEHILIVSKFVLFLFIL